MHHVSTIYARFICRELALTEEAADQLLSGSGLRYRDIIQQAQMPYPDFFSFLRQTQQQYPDNDLGLRVGSKLAPPSLGELGSAMLSAPNMMASLTLSVTFVSVHAAYYRLELTSTSTGVQMRFIELTELADTRQFQTEVMMHMVQNLIEAVSGSTFQQGRFYFPYAKPQHADQYPDFFNSPCQFSAKHAAIDIPQPMLKLPSPFYHPEAWQQHQVILQQQLQKLQSSADTTALPYKDRVQRFLAMGPLPLPGAEQTAHAMNMTSRSLNRHLKHESTCFRDIKNQLLKEYAAYYLTGSDSSIDSIACQLGYQDFSSFRRVFKRWYGCSPSAFRDMHKI